MQAHYLKWYIPPHIAGSRALNRSAKSATAKYRINASFGHSVHTVLAVTSVLLITISYNIIIQKSSPLHNSEKQAWLNKLIGEYLAFTESDYFLTTIYRVTVTVMNGH